MNIRSFTIDDYDAVRDSAHYILPFGKRPEGAYDAVYALWRRTPGAERPRLILRWFEDGDIPLLETWLRREHVAAFFEHPEDWLAEARKRCGEFRFIRHFIAECESKPVGFCQYYDCYHGQKYEDWYSVDAAGKVFSMDYLVGECEYLRRGYGSEMVRLLVEKIRGEARQFPGVKKIIVDVDAANVPSRKTLEANNFVYNGSFYEFAF